MVYYAKVLNKTIQILPVWKIPTLDNNYDEAPQIINKLGLNGDFYIPIANFKINKVPANLTIKYGTKTYEKLSTLVEELYNSRTFSYTKERALSHIETLAIKAILNKKTLYGKEISYRFDFIDASNYNIIY